MREDWQTGYVERKGLRLHYTRTGGDKPPLVLAHGVTDAGPSLIPRVRYVVLHHTGWGEPHFDLMIEPHPSAERLLTWRTAASTCVASVLCWPRSLSNPHSRSRTSMASSRLGCTARSTSRPDPPSMDAMRSSLHRDRQVGGCWTGYNAALERPLLKKSRLMNGEADERQAPFGDQPPFASEVMRPRLHCRSSESAPPNTTARSSATGWR